MSKDKPEENDIWINSNNTRVRIIYIDEYSVTYYSRWGNYLDKHNVCMGNFLKEYKYLGKPTTDIAELFEISDETWIEQ